LISNDVEQLITVPSGTKVYGEDDWTIVAHTNAPLDLQVGVSGDGCEQVGDPVNAPATGGGTDATITLHILQVGSCTVEAGNTGGLVGDDNWLGNSAQGEWTVTPADLIVTTDNQTCQYGDATPEFTGTISTVYYSDGITASWSSANDCNSDVSGSPYAIVATVNDPNNRLFNYNLTSSDGELTITPAPLSVVVDNVICQYGSTTPAFSGTLTGVLNDDGITASYSSTASCGSPVSGSPYAITATLNDLNSQLGNYDVTNTPGTLTVTPAPLVITAANKTMYIGNPIPACTIASYATFVNGDTSASLSGLLCSYTGPAANAVTAFTTYTGVYQPSGAVNNNYTISYAFGDLTTLGKCTYSQGYWKNHASVWSSVSLPAVPGYPTYTTQTLWLKLFNTSAKKGDQTIIRAYQWMAAWLNINVQGATDTNPSILGATATQLEAFNAGVSHCSGDTSSN
jgi:hypothetical protein